MQKYILDANVVFSALIGGREIFIQLFEKNKFYAPDFILTEIDKYKKIILKKSKLPLNYFQDFIHRLFKQITIIPDLFITNKNKDLATVLCNDIDIKDVTYVALSLEMNIPIITRDKKLYEGLINKNFKNIILLDDFLNSK